MEALWGFASSWFLNRMKHVVITGISSGIGLAAARHLAQHDYHVYGSVRKEADVARVQATVGENFTPLFFDVTDEDAICSAKEQVEHMLNGRGLTGLINNAGIAVAGPLMHLELDAVRQQFEVNVIGALAVMQAFLPLLGADATAAHPPGRIVNISSVSGRLVFPFLGPYAASKHALEALSDALRRELRIYGIDVIVIEPGSVRTPIWDKADQVDLARFDRTDYGPIVRTFMRRAQESGRAGMSPTVIGRAILDALEQERPHARHAIPNRYVLGWLLPRLLPARWLDRVIARRLGLFPPGNQP